MTESDLLVSKRAALADALKAQVLAQKQIERYERSRPLLDGVQVGIFEVVVAREREFPWPVRPSTESKNMFYGAIQDYLASIGAEYFVHGIAAGIAGVAEWGARTPGWISNLRPIFELSKDDALRHVQEGFRRCIEGSNMNSLWPNIAVALRERPIPGPGQIVAATKLAQDQVWADLAELAKQPESDMREAAREFCENTEGRVDAFGERASAAAMRFREALSDFRDGHGRWQELDEIDEKLRRSWIEIAGLPSSTPRDLFIAHHLNTMMIADGSSIAGMEGYSIGGLEGEIALIEANGGVMPAPPQRRRRMAKTKPTRRRRTNVAITKEMLTTAGPLLIRTDFTSDAAWSEIRDAAMAILQVDGGEGAGGYDAFPNVVPIDDRLFDGLTTEELLDLPWPDPETEDGPVYFFVVDDETVGDPEHPILALSLFLEKGDSFRLVPGAMAMVEMNLSIANLGFDDYANAEEDGVVRFTGA